MFRPPKPSVHGAPELRFQKPAAPRIELSGTRALYVGPPLGVGLHRGAVSCFALALDSELEVTSESPRGKSGRVRSALIDAGLRHQIDVAGSAAAFLYLDPADTLADLLRTEMRPIHPRLHVSYSSEGALADRLSAGGSLDMFPVGGPAAIDARIAQVLEAMRRGEWLDAEVAEVARAVALSASRFMHLFSASTGVPFRRYRIWARLHLAVSQFGAGSTWTTAALASSFASSSHFTDAFRSMFGVPPSVLRGMQLTIVAPAATESITR